jgi:hypothetical protein
MSKASDRWERTFRKIERSQPTTLARPPSYESDVAAELRKLREVLGARPAEEERERKPPAPQTVEPVEKEPDAVPVDTPKPLVSQDQRQAAPHDDKTLRKWILVTCDRHCRSVGEDGLTKWLLAQHAVRFGEQANEESLRRKFDRHLKLLEDYPREW